VNPLESAEPSHSRARSGWGRAFLLLALLALSAKYFPVTPPVTDSGRLQIREMRLQAAGEPEATPLHRSIRWRERTDLMARVRRGAFVIEATVEIPPGLPPLEVPALNLSLTAAYRLWWDGIEVGGSGQPGRPGVPEVPGPLDQLYPLPSGLVTPGVHTLRWEATAEALESRDRFYLSISLGEYADLLLRFKRYVFAPMLLFGAFLVLAAYGFMRAWGDPREAASRIFGGLCLTAAGLLVIESWRALFGLPYDALAEREQLRLALALLASGLLVRLVQHQFAVGTEPLAGWRGWMPLGVVLLGTGTSLVLGRSEFGSAIAALGAGLGVSLFLTLRAANAGRPQADLVLGGLTLCALPLVGDPINLFETHFYYAFTGLSLAMLAAYTRRSREQRAAAEAARRRAAALESELLKRHLQPHFILNSLTGILELIETSPERAGRFVESLAGEFRLFADLAGRRWVRWEQEMVLCQAHAALMAERLERPVSFAVSGGVPGQPVPPALFHTLLENGITHGSSQPGALSFSLAEHREPGRLRWQFVGPGTVREELATGPGREGLGLRYLRARLDDLWPGRWTLEHGPVEGGWQTLLEVRNPDQVAGHPEEGAVP